MTPAALPSSADPASMMGLPAVVPTCSCSALSVSRCCLTMSWKRCTAARASGIVLGLGELAVEGFFDMRFQRHHVPDVVGNRLLVLLLDLALSASTGPCAPSPSLGRLCRSASADQSAEAEDGWVWLNASTMLRFASVHRDL